MVRFCFIVGVLPILVNPCDPVCTKPCTASILLFLTPTSVTGTLQLSRARSLPVDLAIQHPFLLLAMTRLIFPWLSLVVSARATSTSGLSVCWTRCDGNGPRVPKLSEMHPDQGPIIQRQVLLCNNNHNKEVSTRMIQ